MKTITKKAIISILTALILINSIFPRIVFAALSSNEIEQKLHEVIDLLVYEKIDELYKNGLNEDEIKNQVNIALNSYNFTTDSREVAVEFKNLLINQELDPSSYDGAARSYIGSINLDNYIDEYKDKLQTEEEPVPTVVIPDAPLTEGEIQSSIRQWVENELDKYNTDEERANFLERFRNDWENIVINDIKLNIDYNYVDKDRVENIVNSVVSEHEYIESLYKVIDESTITLDQAKQMLNNELSALKVQKEEEWKDLDEATRLQNLKNYFLGLASSTSGEFYEKIIEIANKIRPTEDRETFLGSLYSYVVSWIERALGNTTTTVDAIFNLFSITGDALAGILTYKFKLLLIIVPGAIIQLSESLLANIGNNKSFAWITLDDIFFNKLPILDIDIFNFDTAAGSDLNTDSFNPLLEIRRNVAGWYYSIRVLCIALALAVLIYIGIRMAISSVADERTKYQKMLKDWLVGFALLFVLHYIIIFVIQLNNGIIDVLDKARQTQETQITQEMNTISNIGNITDPVTGAVTDAIQGTDIQSKLLGESFSPFFSKGMGSALLYVMLVAMTLAFLVIYIKRFITLCFLVMIAPIITVTYSIDKAGDGRAQALGKWFKEFVFNILIQPFHCIIYMVFLQNIFAVINNSVGVLQIGKIFVAIIMLGFMFKSEDIVKEIFGFETKSLGSAAVLGATMLKNAQKVGGRIAKYGKGVDPKNAGEKASAIKNMRGPDGLPSNATSVPVQNQPNLQPAQNQPSQAGSGKPTQGQIFKDDLKKAWDANTGKTARNIRWKNGKCSYRLWINRRGHSSQWCS